MKLLEAFRENPETAIKTLKSIREERVRSSCYREFYAEKSINPTNYPAHLLIRAFEQWNSTWGRCTRCNPSICNIRAEHVEIHDGKIVEVICTRQPKKQLIELPGKLKDKSIEDYEPQNESQRVARDKTLKLIDNPESVIYWGHQKGIGKTMCASALFNSIREDRLYYNFVTLINRMKSKFASNESVDSIVDELFNVRVLFIDDFGRGNYTEWIRDTLYDMIEQRSNKGLMTILTCDLKEDEMIRKLGVGILSRLKEHYHIIRMSGDDYRDVIQSRKEHQLIGGEQ